MPPNDVSGMRIKHHLHAIERLANASQAFVVVCYPDGEVGMIFCGQPLEGPVRQALTWLAASDWNASKTL